jgi:hypothetical protein
MLDHIQRHKRFTRIHAELKNFKWHVASGMRKLHPQINAMRNAGIEEGLLIAGDGLLAEVIASNKGDDGCSGGMGVAPNLLI